MKSVTNFCNRFFSKICCWLDDRTQDTQSNHNRLTHSKTYIDYWIKLIHGSGFEVRYKNQGFSCIESHVYEGTLTELIEKLRRASNLFFFCIKTMHFYNTSFFLFAMYYRYQGRILLLKANKNKKSWFSINYIWSIKHPQGGVSMIITHPGNVLTHPGVVILPVLHFGLFFIVSVRLLYMYNV